MEPQAPTIASQGLTRMPVRPSTGRAPAFSSRVKQSCMLRKWLFFASLKSRSENSRHVAIERSRTTGCSIRLNQPMNWVARRRGMRLVRRKLMSSCAKRRSSWARTVMALSTPAGTPRFGDRSRNDWGYNDLGENDQDESGHDSLGGNNIGILWNRRGGGCHLGGQAAPAYPIVASQTPVARR